MKEITRDMVDSYTEKVFEEGYAVAKRLYYKEKEIIKAIEESKEITRKETGAFKYDECYDECIKIVKKIYEV